MQRGYRPEPWNAPRAARKPEASLRSVQARAGCAGGRPRSAPRCCSLAALENVCLPPRTSASSKPCGAWLREPHGVGDCYQSPTPCRMPRIRLGRQACGLDDVPACGRGGRRTKLHPSFRHCKKQNLRANSKLQLPGSFRRFCLLIIPPKPAPIPGHSS